MLRQAVHASAAAGAPVPWVVQLQRVVQGNPVFPHARVLVMTELQNVCGLSDADAMAFENEAYSTSNGHLSLYMTLVQELLARPQELGTLGAFSTFCRQPDASHQHLGDINAKRDEILEIIASYQLNIESGTRACPRCKCRQLLVDERQTRGADEETTKFFTCTREECQFRFR